jgi:hypothetical protein
MQHRMFDFKVLALTAHETTLDFVAKQNHQKILLKTALQEFQSH